MQAEITDDYIQKLAHNTTSQSAMADNVTLKCLIWRAARLNPRRYGERIEHTIAQVTHTAITKEMSLDQAMEIYGDMVKRPLALADHSGPLTIDLEANEKRIDEKDDDSEL
jgi:hypothetical protein